MRNLIIIPTYNEIGNIKNIVSEIRNVLSSYDYSILIIDDNSTDGTKDVVLKLAEQNENIFLINREGKLGLASAYIEGFKFGLENNFDAMIQMDADFSHNPKYLPEMFDKLANYDVVIGSRNIKGGSVVGWSFLRNFISKGGSLYSKIILGCTINDLTGGFNGWKKDALKKINLDSIISKGYSFQIEMKYKAFKNKLNIIEFPIIFEDRKFGESKMSKDIFFEALLNVLKIRFGK